MQVLALRKLLRRGGGAASLPLASASALHSACGALEEALGLAHKLSKARQASNARLFLQPGLRALHELPPGELLLVPLHAGSPLVLIVHRRPTPHDALCTLALGACTDSSLRYHECAAQPPKLKYRTTLELRDVPHERICDEAVWAGLWYAMHA